MPKSSISDKSLAFSFDAENREAQKVARKYSAAQITLIGDETKLAIRRIITRSIREGIPPRDAAKLIRNVVGMTRPQANAYKAYYEKLDRKLWGGRIWVHAGVYNTQKRKKWARRSLNSREASKAALRRKYIRRRAIMIARTEVMDALNTGAEVAWKQAKKQGLLGKNAGKEWVATPGGACPVCQALNGTVVLLGRKFQSSVGALSGPTAHPNCRCAVAPAEAELDEAIAPDRVKAKVRKKTTRKGLKAEGKVEVKAGTVNAEGALLHGSDVRKALSTYAEELPEGRQILKEIERHKPALAQVQQQIKDFPKVINRKYAALKKQARQKNKLVSFADKHKLETELLEREQQLLSRKQRLIGLSERPLARQAEHVRERFFYNATENKMFETTSKLRFTKVEDPVVREGVTAFRRMIDDTIGTLSIGGTSAEIKIVSDIKKAVVNFTGRVKRAFAREEIGAAKNYVIKANFKSAKIRPQELRRTIVHEMSHTAEMSSPDVLAEAIRYRDLRTKGEKVQKLDDLLPGYGYEKTGEVAYRDGWIGEDVYIGKRYREGARLGNVPKNTSSAARSNNLVYTKRDGWQAATEVVSRGMDKMYYNPIQFAKDDPKTFDFIYERIIKRKYTNKSSKYALDIGKDLEVVEIVKKSWGDVRSLRLIE